MAKGHAWLPRAEPVIFSKGGVLAALLQVDQSPASRQRILNVLEPEFRARVAAHIASLPTASSSMDSFSTSPFVLMVYAKAYSLIKISEIERAILPAKLFSSMETSAGRMIEEVMLPAYGWARVPSGMHTANSSIDGLRLAPPVLQIATLKSGPRCLNDEMSENFADAIVDHGATWLAANGVSQLEWTYASLYGTYRKSNKKDWHILRNIYAKLGPDAFATTPQGSWSCDFTMNTARVTATVRIGNDWWAYLGGPLCIMEMCVALIRACVPPGIPDPAGYAYAINDLADIVSTPPSLAGFNCSIIQSSQLPWLFLLMSHFCDDLIE